MNDEIKKFNTIIEEIASKNMLRCIGFELSDDDFFDGVHLNTKGVNTVAYQLYNYILMDKSVESPSNMS